MYELYLHVAVNVHINYRYSFFNNTIQYNIKYLGRQIRWRSSETETPTTTRWLGKNLTIQMSFKPTFKNHVWTAAFNRKRQFCILINDRSVHRLIEWWYADTVLNCWWVPHGSQKRWRWKYHGVTVRSQSTFYLPHLLCLVISHVISISVL